MVESWNENIQSRLTQLSTGGRKESEVMRSELRQFLVSNWLEQEFADSETTSIYDHHTSILDIVKQHIQSAQTERLTWMHREQIHAVERKKREEEWQKQDELVIAANQQTSQAKKQSKVIATPIDHSTVSNIPHLPTDDLLLLYTTPTKSENEVRESSAEPEELEDEFMEEKDSSRKLKEMSQQKSAIKQPLTSSSKKPVSAKKSFFSALTFSLISPTKGTHHPAFTLDEWIFNGGEANGDKTFKFKSEIRHSFRAHTASILSLSTHPSTGLFLTSSRDTTVKLWTMEPENNGGGVVKKVWKGTAQP